MLLRRSLLGLITIFLLFLHAHALVFKCRPRPDPELSYFLYPVAGSIPGLQDFYDLGATVSGIGGREVDITAVSLTKKQNILRMEISALNSSRY